MLSMDAPVMPSMFTTQCSPWLHSAVVVSTAASQQVGPSWLLSEWSLHVLYVWGFSYNPKPCFTGWSVTWIPPFRGSGCVALGRTGLHLEVAGIGSRDPRGNKRWWLSSCWPHWAKLKQFKLERKAVSRLRSHLETGNRGRGPLWMGIETAPPAGAVQVSCTFSHTWGKELINNS